MSRELDKLRNSIIEAQKRDVATPVSPAFPATGLSYSNPFFTFRYSCTEISSQGGNLSVKMQETRFEDGKFVSEECEGTIDRAVYDDVVREAQQQFMNQIGSFMKLLFLPFSGGDRR
jgi:hypothetical protein